MYLVVWGSKNQQRRGWDYSNFTKGENLLVFQKDQVQFGVISPCTNLPCPFEKRPSSFLQFDQAENIHGQLFEKIFLICFRPLIPTGRVERG